MAIAYTLTWLTIQPLRMACYAGEEYATVSLDLGLATSEESERLDDRSVARIIHDPPALSRVAYKG